ncbi:5933_t:CDS:2 [Ambispora leptoticha]|uniref:5933_t:CDS:1 n=1 Tax=Ambispora leptoticha TaxID=144679 RepID=A0A9N8WQX0_9GLOM|nr:5933_t:CDS:2 [Ambispora leptoticha]
MNSPNEDDYSDHKDDDLSLLVEKNNMENLNFTNQVISHANYENTPRHCSVCGQAGHNARTCTSQDSYIDYDISLSIAGHNNANVNYENKFCRCGNCGQTGHNACTCNATK